MSNNFPMSDDVLRRPIPSYQPATRTRTISACNAPPHYHANFPQPNESIPHASSSWTQAQTWPYINGAYPGGTMSSVDGSMVNNSDETQKYNQDIKTNRFSTPAVGHTYHPQQQQQHAGAHGTMQLALTPLSNTQPLTNVNLDGHVTPNQLQSSSSQQGSTFYNSSFASQQPQQHHAGHPQQNLVSPPLFSDPYGTDNGVHSHANEFGHNINGSNDATTNLVRGQLPISQASLTTQIQLASHPTTSNQQQQQQLFSTQQPPPGVIEFLPTMYTTDPSSQATVNPQSVSMFNQFAMRQTTPHLAMDAPFVSRVRHNTWSGLDSTQSYEYSNNNNNNNNNNINTDRGSTINGFHPTVSKNGIDHHTLAMDNTMSPSFQPGFTQSVDNNTYPTMAPFDQSVVQPNQSSRKQGNSGLVQTASSLLPSHNGNDAFDLNGMQCNPMDVPRYPPRWPSNRSSSCSQITSATRVNNQTTNMFNQHRSNPPTDEERLAFGAEIPHTGTEGQFQPVDTLYYSGTSGAKHVRNPRNADIRLPHHSVSNQEALPFRSGYKQAPTNFLTNVGFPLLSNQQHKPTDVQWNQKFAHPYNQTLRQQSYPVGCLRMSQPMHKQFPTLNHPPTVSVQSYLNHVDYQRLNYAQPTMQLAAGSTEPNVIGFSRTGEPVFNYIPKTNGLRNLLDACPLRVLISTVLVGAVIGRGGRVIRSITSMTGAQIDFQQNEVLFSQFSASVVKSRATMVQSPSPPTTIDNGDGESLISASGSDQADGNSTDLCKQDTPPETLAPVQPTPPKTVNSNSTNAYDLSRSQLVILSGSGEQCSAALAQVLEVCFRESQYKGLSDPCLGLVVRQDLYARLLRGRGRKYFNLLHSITGARITMTRLPTQTPSTEQLDRVESIDRIIVVRGHLAAICAAEAFISEHIRFLHAEQLVAPMLWPLIPYLPVNLLPQPSDRSKSAASRTGGQTADLQTVNNVILSIADVFWPHSVSLKLSKHPSFHRTNRRGDTSSGEPTEDKQSVHSSEHSLLGACPDSVTDAWMAEKSDVEEEEDDDEDQSLTASPVEVPVEADKEDITEDTTKVIATEEEVNDGATESGDAEHDISQPGTPTHQSSLLDETDEALPVDFAAAPSAAPLSETDLALATAIQQSLVAIVGPNAWCATSGVLYMRATFNEAGVLIGTGGHRIHQLMQTTGAEIHIGKTSISGPYALQSRTLHEQDHDESAEEDEGDAKEDEGGAKEDEGGAKEDEGGAKENEEVAKENEEVAKENEEGDKEDKGGIEGGKSKVEDPVSVHEDNASADSDSPQKPILEQSQHSNHTTRSLSASPVPPASTEKWSGSSPQINNLNAPSVPMKVPPSPPSSPNQTTETVEGSESVQSTQLGSPVIAKPTSSPYRLVSLSGAYQSQLMAHWRIFQRLKALHNRDYSNIVAEKRSPLRLATLVCLPYRFLCWLTASNSGFADFMSTSTAATTSSDSTQTANPNHNRCPTSPNRTNDLRVETSSPLNWLQSQASRRMQQQNQNTDSITPESEEEDIKAIHILPEPRRRRRLVQQQLRRSGVTRRGDPTKRIFLPPLGLANDGLDLLWSDPNRVPMEIFADYETTQVVLAHLHHMLALWIYGQALASPINSPFTQPPPPMVFIPPPNVSMHGSGGGPNHGASSVARGRFNEPGPPHWRSMNRDGGQQHHQSWQPNFPRTPGGRHALDGMVGYVNHQSSGAFGSSHQRFQRALDPRFNLQRPHNSYAPLLPHEPSMMRPSAMTHESLFTALGRDSYNRTTLANAYATPPPPPQQQHPRVGQLTTMPYWSSVPIEWDQQSMYLGGQQPGTSLNSSFRPSTTMNSQVPTAGFSWEKYIADGLAFEKEIPYGSLLSPSNQMLPRQNWKVSTSQAQPHGT